MFVYEIPMKFKKASAGFVYSTMQRELNVGKEQFNEKAEKMKKGRKIREVNCKEDGIVIIMESQEELVNPSKALAVFSQALAKMESLASLKDTQNHLLANNGQAKEIEKDDSVFVESTCEVLKTVVDIFMNANASDSVFVIQGRREAQQKIIEVCREFHSFCATFES